MPTLLSALPAVVLLSAYVWLAARLTRRLVVRGDTGAAPYWSLDLLPGACDPTDDLELSDDLP